MSKLVDTFSSDLLNPFNSIKTCLNNFSGVIFDNYLPTYQNLSDNTRPYEFTIDLNHPTHVRDIFISYRLLSPLGFAFSPILCSVNEIDSIGRRFENFQIYLNNIQLNTNHGYSQSLNSFFKKDDMTNCEEGVEGKLYQDNRSILYNYTTVLQGGPTLGTPASQLNWRRTYDGRISLGHFCNFFDQDTVLPENTRIRLSFNHSNSPGFNLQYGLIFPDNYVFSTGSQSIEGSTFDYSWIPRILIFRRVIRRENIHKAELMFKCKWREFLPWQAILLDGLNNANSAEPRFYGKFTKFFQQIPEFLSFFISLGQWLPFSPVTSWTRVAQVITLKSGVTFQYGNLALNSSTTNPISRFLYLDNARYFRQLRININGVQVFDYDYDASGLELDYYIKSEQDDFNSNPNFTYDNLLKTKLFFINLTNKAGQQDTFSTLNGGEITVEYTIVDYLFPTPINRNGQLHCWYSQRQQTQIDAYRRTWRD
jgi:hypothetical protein